MPKKKSSKDKDDNKYLELFIDEALEQVEAANDSLMRLESDRDDSEELNECFRLIHTIKGTSNLLGLTPIGELSHAMEDLLVRVREKKARFSDDIIDLLFRGVDTLGQMVREVSAKGKVKTSGSGIIDSLRSFTDDAAPSQGEGGSAVEAKEVATGFTPAVISGVAKALTGPETVYSVRYDVTQESQLREGRMVQMIKRIRGVGTFIASSPAEDDYEGWEGPVTILCSSGLDADGIASAAASVAEVQVLGISPVSSTDELKDGPGQDSTSGPGGGGNIPMADTVRVKSRYLDSLLDLVGELMISDIRVRQMAGELGDKELKQALKNSDRLIGELQNYVLRMRLVPLETIFRRFPRMVRDLSHSMGKDVDLDISGGDIEIDRSLLDNVGDALMHIIRNSLDHGIEPKAARKKAGKYSTGSIRLSAHSEGSNVLIEIEDDGGGIDAEAIARTAVKRGLLSSEEAAALDDKGRLGLAFKPGLSTARKVSNVSGRGVGLDVVNEKIARLGGSVKIDSKEGHGTKVSLRLPPSMAIIRAMLVEVNEEKYAIPIENIVETVKIRGEDIHNVSQTGMIQLRDEVLPVLDLTTRFGGGGSTPEEAQLPMIVVEKEREKAGLLVTDLIDQQEIVIKNLDQTMQRSRYFSGATILGDGKVAMILDVGAFL